MQTEENSVENFSFFCKKRNKNCGAFYKIKEKKTSFENLLSSEINFKI